MKIVFASKDIMFEETFEFKNAIIMESRNLSLSNKSYILIHLVC
jgi:hypothetical protein